jgi:hypothetical protein
MNEMLQYTQIKFFPGQARAQRVPIGLYLILTLSPC